MGPTRLIRRAGELLRNPAFECGVNELAAGPQVSSNAFDRPPLKVESNDGQTPLDRILECRVGRISALRAGGFRASGENQLDRMRRGSATKLSVADRGDFVEGEGGIFRFQIDDGLSHRGGRLRLSSLGIAGGGSGGSRLDIPAWSNRFAL